MARGSQIVSTFWRVVLLENSAQYFILGRAPELIVSRDAACAGIAAPAMWGF